MAHVQTWQWVMIGITAWCLVALVFGLALGALIGRTLEHSAQVEARQQRHRRANAILSTLRRRS